MADIARKKSDNTVITSDVCAIMPHGSQYLSGSGIIMQGKRGGVAETFINEGTLRLSNVL
jgi:hypothetical protein